jgi:hypothetical protein
VNVTAQHLKDNWVQLRALAQGALNNATANTAAGKIASSILSLMDETKIPCNLCFMVAFSCTCFVRHMKWLQMIDERAGAFGRVSRNVPVRTHLTARDLEELANGWEDDEHCRDFADLGKTCVGRVTAEGGQDPTQEDEMNENGTFRAASDSHACEDVKKEVKLFFDEAIAAAKKHFTKEWAGALIHFAVAGESGMSVPFCKWLVNGTTNG